MDLKNESIEILTNRTLNVYERKGQKASVLR
jgi:hypothetical protein